MAVLLEGLDHPGHRIDMVGGARRVFDRLEAERRRVAFERLDELLRVLTQRPPGLDRLRDRPVVNVGVVAHLAHGVALELEHAPQHVERDECPEVPDVATRVDRQAARVHADAIALRRREVFFPAGERVEESQVDRASIAQRTSGLRRTSIRTTRAREDVARGRAMIRDRSTRPVPAPLVTLAASRIDRLPQLRGIARGRPGILGELPRQFAGERTELTRRGDGEPHLLFARPISHTRRFYSEMWPNSRRADRQSASICSRRASTSGNARSSRRRWTKDSRTPRVVQIAIGVEEMRLDLQAIDVAEGGTKAHVRHRRVRDPVDRRGRGIDAGRRQQLVRGQQVRGGKPQLAPALRRPSSPRAVDEIVVAEQRARLRRRVLPRRAGGSACC